MSNLSLYNAVSELVRIENALDQEDFAMSQQELIDIIKTKADSIVYFSNSQDDHLEAVVKRIAEMNDYKKSLENKISRFEQYLISCIEILGGDKITGEFASISLRKPTKKCNVYDVDLIPVEFLETVTTTKVKISEITTAIKNGQAVAGADLIDGKKSLNMRIGK